MTAKALMPGQTITIETWSWRRKRILILLQGTGRSMRVSPKPFCRREAQQFLNWALTGTLASIGTAGVPGAGLIMLAMVLTTVGLPMEGLALVAGIDRVLDMFRTCLNITGDGAVAIAIDYTEKKNGELHA